MQVKCRSSVTASTNSKSVTGNRKGRRHDIVKLSMYKTSICTFFTNPGGCPFGEHCAFAHGEEELRKQPDESVEESVNDKICRPYRITSNTELAKNISSAANFAKEVEKQLEEKRHKEQQQVVEQKVTECKKESNLEENLFHKENNVAQIPSSTLSTSSSLLLLPSSSPELNSNTPMCTVSEYKMPVGLAQSPISNINKRHPINTSTTVTTFAHSTSSPFSVPNNSNKQTEFGAISSSLSVSHGVEPSHSESKHFVPYNGSMHHQYYHHNHHHTNNYQHHYQHHQIHHLNEQQQYSICSHVPLSDTSSSSPTNVIIQNRYMPNINNSNNVANMLTKAPETFICNTNTVGQTASSSASLAATNVSDSNKYFFYPTQPINEPVNVAHTSLHRQESTRFSASHTSSSPVPDVAQPTNTTATTATTSPSPSTNPFVHAAVTNNTFHYQNNNGNNPHHNSNNGLLSHTSISVLQPFGFTPSPFCPIVPVAHTSSSSSMTLLPLTSAHQINSSTPTHTLPLTSSTPLPLSQLNMPALGINTASPHLSLPPQAAVFSLTNPEIATLVTAVPKFIADTTVYQIPLNLHTWHNETAGMWPSTAAAYYYLASQQQQQQQKIDHSYNPEIPRQHEACQGEFPAFGEASTIDKYDGDNDDEEQVAIVDTNNNNYNNVGHIASEPLRLSSSELHSTNIPLFTSVVDETDNDVGINELGSEWATLIEKWANSIKDDYDQNDIINNSDSEHEEESFNDQDGKQHILDNNSGNNTITKRNEDNDKLNIMQNDHSSATIAEECIEEHVSDIDKTLKPEQDEMNTNLSNSNVNLSTSRSVGGKESEDEDHNKHPIITPEKSVTEYLRETISPCIQPMLDTQILLPKHASAKITSATATLKDLPILKSNELFNVKTEIAMPSSDQMHKTTSVMEDAPMHARNALVTDTHKNSVKTHLPQPLQAKLTSRSDSKRGIMSNYFKSSCAAEAVSNAVLLYCTKREVVVTSDQPNVNVYPTDEENNINNNDTVKETLYNKEVEPAMTKLKEISTDTKEHFVKSFVHISGVDKPVLCRVRNSNNEQHPITIQQISHNNAKTPTCTSATAIASNITIKDDLENNYTKQSNCTFNNSNFGNTDFAVASSAGQDIYKRYDALETYIDYIIEYGS